MESYLNERQLRYLLMPIDRNRVKFKQGQSHLESHDIRRHLTMIFGFGRWSGEVLSMELVSQLETVNRSNKPAWIVVYRCAYKLTVKAPDGTELATYTEWAMGDAINYAWAQLGAAHDFAIKTAESQALKRCAINLGDQFGLSLYNGGSVDKFVPWTFVTPQPNEVDETKAAPAVEANTEETAVEQHDDAQKPAPAPQATAGTSNDALEGQGRPADDSAPDADTQRLVAIGQLKDYIADLPDDVKERLKFLWQVSKAPAVTKLAFEDVPRIYALIEEAQNAEVVQK